MWNYYEVFKKRMKNSLFALYLSKKCPKHLIQQTQFSTQVYCQKNKGYMYGTTLSERRLTVITELTYQLHKSWSKKSWSVSQRQEICTRYRLQKSWLEHKILALNIMVIVNTIKLWHPYMSLLLFYAITIFS